MMSNFSLKIFTAIFPRVALALLMAGIFYVVWMSVFIVVSGSAHFILKAFLWLIAPVITGLGFATGIWICERRDPENPCSFLQIVVWPWIGCAIGAGAVFWFGPMLIVFGMFVVGTAGIVLREIIVHYGGKQI